MEYKSSSSYNHNGSDSAANHFRSSHSCFLYLNDSNYYYNHHHVERRKTKIERLYPLNRHHCHNYFNPSKKMFQFSSISLLKMLKYFYIDHRQSSSCLCFRLFLLIIIISLCHQLIMDLMVTITTETANSLTMTTTNVKTLPNFMILVGTMATTVGGVNAQQIKCGELKQCSKMFREATLSNNLSYDLTNERIEQICVKLNRAVQCFNNYRKMCINDNFQHSKMTADFYDQMSEGPLGLTMELCNNPKFKHDYLTLGPCQKKYGGEFDQCLQPSNSQSQNGSNSTILEQFIEHCCALHNFHNCIYDISLDRCGKDAAEFSLKILELFHRGYLRECSKYANLSHLCVRNRLYSSKSHCTSLNQDIFLGTISFILLSIFLFSV